MRSDWLRGTRYFTSGPINLLTVESFQFPGHSIPLPGRVNLASFQAQHSSRPKQPIAFTSHTAHPIRTSVRVRVRAVGFRHHGRSPRRDTFITVQPRLAETAVSGDFYRFFAACRLLMFSQNYMKYYTMIGKYKIQKHRTGTPSVRQSRR